MQCLAEGSDDPGEGSEDRDQSDGVSQLLGHKSMAKPFLEVIEVSLGCYVGPTDRWQVFHEDVRSLRTEDLLQCVVQVVTI